MSGRLVYVVGPSGAGKDSVLEYARMRLPANAGIIFARRFITREPGSAGEQHIPLSASAFERVLANGHFALHWDANGLRYGIGREISTWMSLGFHVVVNGSREHLPTALEQFQNTFIVCITAPVEVIRHRLSQRARENDAEIEKCRNISLAKTGVCRYDRTGKVSSADYFKFYNSEYLLVYSDNLIESVEG